MITIVLKSSTRIKKRIINFICDKYTVSTGTHERFSKTLNARAFSVSYQLFFVYDETVIKHLNLDFLFFISHNNLTGRVAHELCIIDLFWVFYLYSEHYGRIKQLRVAQVTVKWILFFVNYTPVCCCSSLYNIKSKRKYIYRKRFSPAAHLSTYPNRMKLKRQFRRFLSAVLHTSVCVRYIRMNNVCT